jgi:hypothetical protein
MTSTSATAVGSSNRNPHFMLTLCRLAAPVSIRPPQSPRLKPFTFFMSRAAQPDGSERLYLHMGYFATMALAERALEAVRHRYPKAFATIAPVPRRDESLTDTQLMKFLGTRHGPAVQDEVDESNCDQIALLPPDDTGTRRALKEAVARGAPVSFAVQLRWSAQPIDLGGVPSLAIFRPHTLYATESRRDERSSYFLRLGFFADPFSAKQVAVQVRSTFASAAVVPVMEQEVTRAREAVVGTSAIPYLGQQRVDPRIDSAPRLVPRSAGAIGQTLEPLAKRRTRTDADSLSESGVRHLRIEVQEHASGRWKILRIGEASHASA